MDAPKSGLKQKQGLGNYLILAFYVWMILALLVSYRSVILSEQRIPFAPHAFALLNALVLAKLILVAQEIVGEWFNEQALIFTTLLKSAVCGVLLGWFKIVEETLVGLYNGLSYKASVAVAAGGGTLMGVLVLMAMLAVILIPLFAFTELSRVLGKEELRTLFFTSRRAAR